MSNNNDFYNQKFGTSRTSDYNGRSQSHMGTGIGSYDRRMTDCPFQLNQVVRHIATGIKLVVINYGREQVECRKPDLSADYFYLHELEAIPEGEEEPVAKNTTRKKKTQ